jgi:general stress protein YciG
MAFDGEPRGRKRGFARMHPDKQRELASKGGRAVPGEAQAFAKDPELARQAGRKGGEERWNREPQRRERLRDD